MGLVLLFHYYKSNVAKSHFENVIITNGLTLVVILQLEVIRTHTLLKKKKSIIILVDPNPNGYHSTIRSLDHTHVPLRFVALKKI